jgi:hypothetical protein
MLRQMDKISSPRGVFFAVRIFEYLPPLCPRPDQDIRQVYIQDLVQLPATSP